MINGNKKRTRQQRVASVELPPGTLGRIFDGLRQGHILLRIALCALTTILLWGIARGWAPPFPYYDGYVPSRDLLARVDFEQQDAKATDEAREKVRSLTLGIFSQDPAELVQLRAKLQIALDKIFLAESLTDLDNQAWQAFEPALTDGATSSTEVEKEKQFQQFRKALTGDDALENFQKAVERSLKPVEQRGLLEEMPRDNEGNPERINQQNILVYPDGKPGFAEEVSVSDVLIGSAAAAIQKNLIEHLPSAEVADRVFAWLKPQLPKSTLTYQREATKAAQKLAAESVPPQHNLYPTGSLLAKADKPLTTGALNLLWLEYQRTLANQSWASEFGHSLAIVGMFVALYTLCGFYICHREPILVTNLNRFFAMLCLVTVTVGLAIVAAHTWRVELIPLILFGMTVAIAYQQELALMLSAAVTLVLVICIGHGISDAVVLMATTAAAILMLGNVRSRSKLLLVGLCAGVVALLTTVGIGTLYGQPVYAVLEHGAFNCMWAVIAGFLMTGLLPFMEKLFGVQTDISLIELGDPAHPLLQELVRRAPGTYNHSITVASLAEVAAESIGARGLLVRVGAYFHDIGKMLKPGYFVENQRKGDSRHESLVPAMSTLVIIAHVKDGADLARQNHLPESIIDFILQHHGTTLVEYFYRRANEQHEADPDGSGVDENSFRYPGPKPRTKEIGVLMLADAVESASRVLVEPTPSRIESLVEEITMKRLMDGQFDECGLTLQEVRDIGNSLVKSLTSVYHGRVKYPDQQTA